MICLTFYEGGLEKGGFSKLNLRKVRRRAGGERATNSGGPRRGLKGGLEGGPREGASRGALRRDFKGGLRRGELEFSKGASRGLPSL